MGCVGGGCYVGSDGHGRFIEVVTFELGIQGYIGICQVEKNTKNSPGRGNSTPETKRYARVYSMATMVKYWFELYHPIPQRVWGNLLKKLQ